LGFALQGFSFHKASSDSSPLDYPLAVLPAGCATLVLGQSAFGRTDVA